MAVRERNGRASPWQCYWNNPLTGKRECANFPTKIEAEKHDSLIKHRLKFDRESFRKEEDQESQEAKEISLEETYFLYLKEKQFNKKSLTWQMDAMRLPLKLYDSLPVAQIDGGRVSSLMDTMSQRPVSQATIRGRLSVLRTVIRWSVAQGFCEPCRFPKLPPARYEKFIPPSPEELAAILAVAEPHIVRVVILGAQCGVRVGPSELLRLTWDDVDLEGRLLRVHGAKKNAAAPWREVPIRTRLMPLFEAWRKEDEQLGIQCLIHCKGRKVESSSRRGGAHSKEPVSLVGSVPTTCAMRLPLS